MPLLKQVESRILILWLAVAAAVWGFFELAGEIAEGDTDALDRHILLALRNPQDVNDPIGSRTFEEAVRDVTALGGFTVLTMITVLAVILFLFHRRWRHAAIMGAVVLLAQFTSGFAKNFYERPRPDLVSHGSYVYSGSFPSGHSMLSAATYLTLAMLLANLETTRSTKILLLGLAVVLTLLIGLSRLYLGVHWPSDVLGGWVLGAAWSLIGWFALLKLRRTPQDS